MVLCRSNKATRNEENQGLDFLSRVYVEDQHFDIFLTDALKNPSLLRGDIACLEAHQHFLLQPVGTAHPLAGQKVLVVGQILDKTKVARLLILLLIVSPSLGIVVGILAHRADVGVAVSAAVFAFTTLFQALVTWICR